MSLVYDQGTEVSHCRISRIPSLAVSALGWLLISLLLVFLLNLAASGAPSPTPPGSTANPSSSPNPSSSDAPATVEATKVMKVEDGCLDDDYITIPRIKGFRYLLNGKVVNGRVKYGANDKLQVGIIKKGKLVGDYYDVSRRAVGLTDSDCGADGKPIPKQTATARPGTNSRVVGSSSGTGLRTYVIYGLIAAIVAVVVGTVIYILRKQRQRTAAHAKASKAADADSRVSEDMRPKWRPRQGDVDQK